MKTHLTNLKKQILAKEHIEGYQPIEEVFKNKMLW